MSYAAELPAWVALLTALLIGLGAALALIGSIGLLRLRTLYERVLHRPWDDTGHRVDSRGLMIFFSMLEGRPVSARATDRCLQIVTTPVTYMLLVRALASGLVRKHESAESTADSPRLPFVKQSKSGSSVKLLRGGCRHQHVAH